MSTRTARRQLQWIAWGTAVGAGTFALGYALPYALGVEPSLPMELSAIPLGGYVRLLGEDPGDLSTLENPDVLEEIANAV